MHTEEEDIEPSIFRKRKRPRPSSPAGRDDSSPAAKPKTRVPPPSKKQRHSRSRARPPELNPAKEDAAPARNRSRKRRPKIRHSNLFDATSGRVPIRGLLTRPPLPPALEHPHKLKQGPRKSSDSRVQRRDAQHLPIRSRWTLPAVRPLSPPSVLFKRRQAPPRYAEPEYDVYGSSRWLASRTTTLADLPDARTYPSPRTVERWRKKNALSQYNGIEDPAITIGDAAHSTPTPEARAKWKEQKRLTSLPDGDMLKALHQYASFHCGRRRMEKSYRSLDETALIAMGILLEESWKEEIIHKDGWRSLVTGEFELDWRPYRSVVQKRTRVAKALRKKGRVDSRPGVKQEDAAASKAEHDSHRNPRAVKSEDDASSSAESDEDDPSSSTKSDEDGSSSSAKSDKDDPSSGEQSDDDNASDPSRDEDSDSDSS